jgi:CrcB protein
LIYFFVGLGGIAGSLLRYFLAFLAIEFWRGDFPAGTLMINLTGSFFLGWITSKFTVPKKLPPQLLTALTTGVIGSYTTFSSFCFDTVELIQSNDFLLAFLYIFISLLGGLFFVKIGITVGEGKAGKSI